MMEWSQWASGGGLGILSGVLLYLHLSAMKAFRQESAAQRKQFTEEMRAEREQCHEDHEKIMTALANHHERVMDHLR